MFASACCAAHDRQHGHPGANGMPQRARVRQPRQTRSTNWPVRGPLHPARSPLVYASSRRRRGRRSREGCRERSTQSTTFMLFVAIPTETNSGRSRMTVRDDSRNSDRSPNWGRTLTSQTGPRLAHRMRHASDAVPAKVRPATARVDPPVIPAHGTVGCARLMGRPISSSEGRYAEGERE